MQLYFSRLLSHPPITAQTCFLHRRKDQWRSCLLVSAWGACPLREALEVWCRRV